ncbi:hypothetical protein OAA99_03010 [Omnitrophica bacterium]|nr:hypothetical protein [Candidatus Omnitrophota bacterium]
MPEACGNCLFQDGTSNQGGMHKILCAFHHSYFNTDHHCEEYMRYSAHTSPEQKINIANSVKKKREDEVRCKEEAERRKEDKKEEKKTIKEDRVFQVKLIIITAIVANIDRIFRFFIGVIKTLGEK